MLHPITEKSLSQIVAEWDALAPVRYHQISSGIDISYNQVIAPALLRQLMPLQRSRVLDAGCGTGAFSARLSEIAGEVVGIDPSARSIEIAQGLRLPGTSFVQATVEEFSRTNLWLFDVVVANMVLMDVLSLDSFLEGCRRTIGDDGRLVFSITHPCFWPEYYGYASASWFQYEKETMIEGPFRISADRVGSLPSTHFHRPLSAYVSAFAGAGLVLQAIAEPTPPPNVNAEYLGRWKFPRYLVGLCISSSVAPPSS
jgi:2-polyprenyl-3-methyl-5-hydroxy-6-metoxy-1,4-benzoquinol methylase